MKKGFMALAFFFVLGLTASNSHAFGIGNIEKAATDTVKVAQAMTITDKQEMEIGAQTHPKILAEFGGELNNKALKTYVEGVGQKLVKVSDRQGITYHFTVLNSPIFNAFAVPGGYVYVTKGLLSAVSDESELAAVIGHEIVHVSHKHGIKQMQKAMAGSAAANAAVGAAGSAGGALAGEALARVSELFLNFAIKGYGRDNERDSDKFGIRFSNKAGYDPNGAIRLFEHLLSLEKGAAKPKGMDALLASHPSGEERVKNAKKEVESLPTPLGKTTNKAQFEKAVKSIK